MTKTRFLNILDFVLAYEKAGYNVDNVQQHSDSQKECGFITYYLSKKIGDIAVYVRLKSDTPKPKERTKNSYGTVSNGMIFTKNLAVNPKVIASKLQIYDRTPNGLVLIKT
jgi:hypothetical protein